MRGFRSYISLCLVLGMTIALFWQTATIIHFYLNRESIAETHCINKENPKKPGCKGQCHLKAQLEKSRPEHDSESGILPQIETSMFLLMFAPQESADETLTLNKKCSNSAQKKSYLENFETDIFHPPKA